MTWQHRTSVFVIILAIILDKITESTNAESTVFDELLSGKILRVAAVEISPFVEFVRDENGNVIEGKGFSFEILNALMETYNFSITIDVPKDKAYGALFSNGTWNGMIGMILNNESDVGIGSFSVTHVRHRVIDFTVAYYEESSGILIPAPIHGKQNSAFIKPFDFRVWVILIAILGILPFITWIQSKVLAKAKFSMVKKRREKRFMLFYGVLLTQSGQHIPEKDHSLRFLAIVWFLCALVFIHAYIGTLISFLSVPNLKPIIRSLEELPTSGLRWIVWRGSDLESLFMEAKDGIYRIIGDELRNHPEWLVESIVEGEQAVVMNGGSVYMNNQARIRYAIEQNFIQSGKKCHLSIAKETFYKVNQAFALPKGSPIGSLFNKKMLIMMETGLMEHWRKKHLSNNNHCGGQIYGTVLSKLSFEDVKSVFLIWIIGLSIASAVFVLENVFFFAGRKMRYYSETRVVN